MFDAQNSLLGWQQGQLGGGGLIGAAQRYIGVPYKWAGNTPAGMDCSGLIQRIYADNGRQVPRTSREQYAASQKVPGGLRNAQPGDLLFWSYDGTTQGVHHVALYIGNGQMIAAPHKGTQVQIQSVYGSPMVGRL
jgi:cell wall-associated NlpC family hydrolase